MLVNVNRSFSLTFYYLVIGFYIFIQPNSSQSTPHTSANTNTSSLGESYQYTTSTSCPSAHLQQPRSCIRFSESDHAVETISMTKRTKDFWPSRDAQEVRELLKRTSCSRRQVTDRMNEWTKHKQQQRKQNNT